MPIERIRPAEWEAHEAMWTALPWDEREWPGNLNAAQDEVRTLCRTLREAGERVCLLAPPGFELEDVELYELEYGDIWLRDTGPHLVWEDGEVLALSFELNGWGGKFDFPADRDLSSRIAEAAGLSNHRSSWILEGGAVELDGSGTCLTTKQCLLNANRNPTMSKTDIEAALARDLGVSTVLWLATGLVGDHTDGHIDTLARFVAPGVVACAEPAVSDPNRAVLNEIAADLQAMRDSAGELLSIETIPSPGLVEDRDGGALPASYLNFVICNDAVVVPQYGVSHDEAALRAVDSLFPRRSVIPSPAQAIIFGGGGLHCITREQPKPPNLQ